MTSQPAFPKIRPSRFTEPAAGFAMRPPITPEANAEMFIASLLGRELQIIVRHEQVARVGVDPDGVHQLRAAARRLRCHLRHCSYLLNPQWVGVMMEELRWYGSALGEVRDLEVMRDVLSACAASLPTADVQHLEPLFTTIATERLAARDDLQHALDSERYAALLSALAAAAGTPPIIVETTDTAEHIARRTVARSWRKLHTAVLELGPTPSDEALHHVRLRAKRARFACEAAIPLEGAPARKLAKAMANVQTVLGTQHDAVVAHQWVRAHAQREAPAVNFSAGMVAGLLRNASQLAAREFPEVWRRASRDKLRAWL